MSYAGSLAKRIAHPTKKSVCHVLNESHASGREPGPEFVDPFCAQIGNVCTERFESVMHVETVWPRPGRCRTRDVHSHASETPFAELSRASAIRIVTAVTRPTIVASSG